MSEPPYSPQEAEGPHGNDPFLPPRISKQSLEEKAEEELFNTYLRILIMSVVLLHVCRMLFGSGTRPAHLVKAQKFVTCGITLLGIAISMDPLVFHLVGSIFSMSVMEFRTEVMMLIPDGFPVADERRMVTLGALNAPTIVWALIQSLFALVGPYMGGSYSMLAEKRILQNYKDGEDYTVDGMEGGGPEDGEPDEDVTLARALPLVAKWLRQRGLVVMGRYLLAIQASQTRWVVYWMEVFYALVCAALGIRVDPFVPLLHGAALGIPAIILTAAAGSDLISVVCFMLHYMAVFAPVLSPGSSVILSRAMWLTLPMVFVVPYRKLFQ